MSDKEETGTPIAQETPGRNDLCIVFWEAGAKLESDPHMQGRSLGWVAVQKNGRF